MPHPSGAREFTLRESACLQGFPTSHQFFGTKTQVKTQIGNAFPPNTVEVLYRHIREWLVKEDGGRQVQVGEDVIMIESDSDSSDSPPMAQFFGADLSPEMEDVVMIDDEEETVLPDRRTWCATDALVIDLT